MITEGLQMATDEHAYANVIKEKKNAEQSWKFHEKDNDNRAHGFPILWI